jgi:hypothetical protein
MRSREMPLLRLTITISRMTNPSSTLYPVHHNLSLSLSESLLSSLSALRFHPGKEDLAALEGDLIAAVIRA